MNRRGFLALTAIAPQSVPDGKTMGAVVAHGTFDLTQPKLLVEGMPCPVCRLISPPSSAGCIEVDDEMATWTVLEFDDKNEARVVSQTEVPLRLFGKYGLSDPVFRVIRGKLKELRECENCGAAFWQEVKRVIETNSTNAALEATLRRIALEEAKRAG